MSHSLHTPIRARAGSNAPTSLLCCWLKSFYCQMTFLLNRSASHWAGLLRWYYIEITANSLPFESSEVASFIVYLGFPPSPLPDPRTFVMSIVPFSSPSPKEYIVYITLSDFQTAAQKEGGKGQSGFSQDCDKGPGCVRISARCVSRPFGGSEGRAVVSWGLWSFPTWVSDFLGSFDYWENQVALLQGGWGITRSKVVLPQRGGLQPFCYTD